MFKLIPTILLISIHYITNVSCRTCVCAEFIAEKCDAILNCKWNPKVPSSGSNDHGLKGICRSLKFEECHVDPDCTIAERDPTNNNNDAIAIKTENEILSAMTHNYRVPGLLLGKDDDMITVEDSADQTNGQTPSEDSDKDWPFDCENNEYLEYTISSSRINNMAQKIYIQKLEEMENKQEMIEDVIIPDGGSTISMYESLNGLQLVSGIIFIIAVIGAMVYYKFIKKDQEDPKYISLAPEDCHTYGSTYGVL